MKSLFFKHFFMTALLILLSFSMLGVAFVSVASARLADERRHQLANNADLMAELSGTYLHGNMLQLSIDFLRYLTTLSRVTESTILVAGASGQVLVCSEMFCEHTGEMIPEAALVLALQDEQGQVGTLGGLFPAPQNYEIRPVLTVSGRVAGFVLVSAPAGQNNSLLAGFVNIFLMASLFVMTVAFISAYVFSRRMTRPLKSMAFAAQSFARGEFSVRAVGADSRDDELGELALAFNAMAESLARAEELRSGFIANISHELKTPMTTISGFIDGILDGTIPPEKQPEYLGIVRTEVGRLSRLVLRMLEISRLQGGQEELPLRPFDIVELIGRILLSFETKIEDKKLVVNLDLPDEPVMAMGDPDGIAQVVYNLLDNAVKYASPEAGLFVSLQKKSGKLLVTVGNGGPEIPPDDLPHVFDRFHKVDKSRGVDKGLGLGLYIVKTILGNHREDIWVKSQDGFTQFTFTLGESKR